MYLYSRVRRSLSGPERYGTYSTGQPGARGAFLIALTDTVRIHGANTVVDDANLRASIWAFWGCMVEHKLRTMGHNCRYASRSASPASGALSACQEFTPTSFRFPSSNPSSPEWLAVSRLYLIYYYDIEQYIMQAWIKIIIYTDNSLARSLARSLATSTQHCFDAAGTLEHCSC